MLVSWELWVIGKLGLGGPSLLLVFFSVHVCVGEGMEKNCGKWFKHKRNDCKGLDLGS